MIHWTPLKPMAENIPTIRGVAGSTNIYSDIKPGPDGCTGLLTCCTKYEDTPRSQIAIKFCLDVLGSDLTSLRKHVIKHLNNIKKESEGAACMEIYLQDGVEWGGVIPVFNEFGINLGNDIAFENPCVLEWWRRANATTT